MRCSLALGQAMMGRVPGSPAVVSAALRCSEGEGLATTLGDEWDGTWSPVSRKPLAALYLGAWRALDDLRSPSSPVLVYRHGRASRSSTEALFFPFSYCTAASSLRGPRFDREAFEDRLISESLCSPLSWPPRREGHRTELGISGAWPGHLPQTILFTDQLRVKDAPEEAQAETGNLNGCV